MARLDSSKQKVVNQILKDSKDVEIYNSSALKSASDISKSLNDIKTALTRSKGKDVTILVSIR